MTRVPSTSMRLVFLLCLCVLFGGSFVSAQGSNLLLNPGFEQPFSNAGGDPARFVANGWTPWHVPATPDMSLNENVQPDYYPSTDTTNGLGLSRVRGGQDAQQYFSFFATHVGGVYQRVTNASPGTAYTFSVFAYIWSSSFDEFDVSEQNGGVILQVGIDPTGGTDGQSPSIVWSSPIANQYDSFDQYQVTATSSGSAITVFVRSSVSFPVKNNVVYLDDASLTAAGSQPPPASATSVPPTAVPPTAVPPTATSAPASATPVVSATSAPPTNTPTQVPPTAEQFATNTPTIPTTPTNTVIPPTPTMTPTVDRVQFPGTIVYVVQRGDSVARIAQLYGSSVDGIISVNGLNSNGFILVGQQLLVPVRLANPVTATPLPTGFVPTATAVPTTAATTVPQPTVVPPTQPPPPQTGIVDYIVRGGDSLGVIALRFNTTVRAISQLNGIVNPNLIFAGQRLRIPQGTGTNPPPLPTSIVLPTLPGGAQPTRPPTVAPIQTYRVQPGDTLYFIALRFGVPLSRIIQVNGLLNPNRIFVGQLLAIPSN